MLHFNRCGPSVDEVRIRWSRPVTLLRWRLPRDRRISSAVLLLVITLWW